MVLVLMVLAMKAQLPSSVTITNFIPCTIGGIPYDFNGTLTLTAPNNYHRVDQTGINYYLFFNTENNINRWQMGYAVNFTPFINRAFFTNASNDVNVIPCTGWISTYSDCPPNFTFSTCIPTCTTPTITGDLDPSVTVCESQQFIIYARAHGAVSDLSVKWQRNGIDITTPFPYQPDNYNGFSYPNVPLSEDGAKYRAVFMSACSGEEVATSECTIHINSSSVSLPSCKTVYFGYDPASSTILTPYATGTPPFSYNWSNDATTESITVNPPQSTTYTVSVTDANGCSASASTLVESINVSGCTYKLKGQNINGVKMCNMGKNKSKTCVSPLDVPYYLSQGGKLGTCGLVVCEPYQPNKANLATNANEHSNPMLEVKKDALLIYPNPTNQDFTIEYNLENMTDVTLSVMDVNGRMLWNKVVENVLEGFETIDITKMPSGVYLVKILPVEGEEQVRRLVIAR